MKILYMLFSTSITLVFLGWAILNGDLFVAVFAGMFLLFHLGATAGAMQTETPKPKVKKAKEVHRWAHLNSKQRVQAALAEHIPPVGPGSIDKSWLNRQGL